MEGKAAMSITTVSSRDFARDVVSPKVREAIEGLALERPRLPIRALYRRIREFAEAVGEPGPSYSTVYRLVRDLPAALLTLAHECGKAYMVE